MEKRRLLWPISVIPLVVTSLLLRFLPEQLPAHYDLAGRIDRWGSKYEKLLFPIMIIAISAHWQLMIRHFEKKRDKAVNERTALEARSNVRVLNLVATLSALMFGIMHFGLLFSAYQAASLSMDKAAIDMHVLLNALIGLMLMLIGRQLPQTGRNSVVGFRTKKSLANDDAWRKQNRFAGTVLVIAGLFILVEALVIRGIASTAVMLGILLAAVAVTLACAHRN